mmetsp:Transcript_1040/g.1915  ORF Transcript_1040/g.1915 Transcript_1040/m.1915 type:complete len:99 (-) Transcript_1040:78-374(-)
MADARRVQNRIPNSEMRNQSPRTASNDRHALGNIHRMSRGKPKLRRIILTITSSPSSDKVGSFHIRNHHHPTQVLLVIRLLNRSPEMMEQLDNAVVSL